MIPVKLIQAMRYRRIFKRAGATSINTAIEPEEYGIRKGKGFHYLVKNEVLIPVEEGRYFLDQEKEILYKKNRGRMAVVFLLSFIIAMILVYLMNRKNR